MCIVRVITVSVRTSLNNRTTSLSVFTRNNRECRRSLNNGATGLCVLYEFKRTKSSQQSRLKPFVRLLKAFRTLALILLVKSETDKDL